MRGRDTCTSVFFVAIAIEEFGECRRRFAWNLPNCTWQATPTPGGAQLCRWFAPPTLTYREGWLPRAFCKEYSEIDFDNLRVSRDGLSECPFHDNPFEKVAHPQHRDSRLCQLSLRTARLTQPNAVKSI